MNENSIFWKENDQNEFEQAFEDIGKQENNKDDDRMIIDNPKSNIYLMNKKLYAFKLVYFN